MRRRPPLGFGELVVEGGDHRHGPVGGRRSGRGGRAVAAREPAAAAATTWGVERWFSSSRTTSMSGDDLGQSGQQRRIGAVPPVDGLVGIPTTHRS